MLNYTHLINVEFEDIDFAGVVNSSKYLSYLERSRIGLLNYINYPLDKMMKDDLFALVAKYEIEYIQPIKIGNKVEIEVSIDKLSERSGKISYTVRAPDKSIYAKAISLMVFVDSRGKPKPASLELVQKLSEVKYSHS